LLKLAEISEITEVPAFSEDSKSFLQDLIDDFGEEEVKEIKNFERITNHDVKAVEYFLKQKCQSNAEIAKVVIHFVIFLCFVIVHYFLFEFWVCLINNLMKCL
jgi:adenylosuccinate lyase